MVYTTISIRTWDSVIIFIISAQDYGYFFALSQSITVLIEVTIIQAVSDWSIHQPICSLQFNALVSRNHWCSNKLFRLSAFPLPHTFMSSRCFSDAV